MIRLDAYPKLQWQKKDDGRYWTHITLGKVGEDLTYYQRSPKGKIEKRIEYVSEDGLFNDDSVKSLVGLPVLLTHPKNKTYSLNREGLRVGNVLSTIGREDGKLIAEVVIDDYRGVELINKLLKEGQTPEASSGYRLKDLIQREDSKYEQIRGIYDHVAAPLLPGYGRAGKDVGLRFDSKDAVSDKQYFDLGAKRRVKTIVVRLDSKEITIADPDQDTEEAIAGLKLQVEALRSDKADLETKLTATEAERDTVKGELDGLKSQPPTDLEGQIKERIDAWEWARNLVPDIKPDYGLDISNIRKKVLSVLKPDLNLDDKSDAYIHGLSEGLTVNSSGKRGGKTDDFLSDQGSREDMGGKPKRSAIAERYTTAKADRMKR